MKRRALTLLVAALATLATLGLTVVAAAPAGAAPPNDPLYGQQWGPKQVRAEQAWARSRGAGAMIAVVDAGVDLDHPDVDGKIVGGATFLGCGTTSCGNGDWQSGPAPRATASASPHGTHVAGIAAAETGNGTGMAGRGPRRQRPRRQGARRGGRVLRGHRPRHPLVGRPRGRRDQPQPRRPAGRAGPHPHRVEADRARRHRRRHRPRRRGGGRRRQRVLPAVLDARRSTATPVRGRHRQAGAAGGLLRVRLQARPPRRAGPGRVLAPALRRGRGVLRARGHRRRRLRPGHLVRRVRGHLDGHAPRRRRGRAARGPGPLGSRRRAAPSRRPPDARGTDLRGLYDPAFGWGIVDAAAAVASPDPPTFGCVRRAARAQTHPNAAAPNLRRRGRARLWWGWGVEEEALDADAVGRLGKAVAERLGTGDLAVRRPPPVDELDLRPPRGAPARRARRRSAPTRPSTGPPTPTASRSGTWPATWPATCATHPTSWPSPAPRTTWPPCSTGPAAPAWPSSPTAAARRWSAGVECDVGDGFAGAVSLDLGRLDRRGRGGPDQPGRPRPGRHARPGPRGRPPTRTA